jgi:hypothetical protein
MRSGPAQAEFENYTDKVGGRAVDERSFDLRLMANGGGYKAGKTDRQYQKWLTQEAD